MPVEETFQEKTEPATPRRQQEARKRGETARSQEINSLLTLVGGLLLLRFLGPKIFGGLSQISAYLWRNASVFPLTLAETHIYFCQEIVQISQLLLPVILGIMLIGIAVNLMQVGFLFTTFPLTPDLNRINPAKGFRNLFSKQAFIRLLFSSLKIIIIGYLAYTTIRAQLPQLLSLTGKSIGQIFLSLVNSIYQLGLRCILGLVPLAVLDYIFQRWEHSQKLRMTRQETLEEHKQTEGNPLLKSRIRNLQRQIARQRMMQEVPRADVVITNPTQVAVALKYEREKMDAPVVVAKGARLIAEKIKELAREYGVPLVENRWLAQALYKSVEIGEEIPIKFYQAVAEILAYIYRLKKS